MTRTPRLPRRPCPECRRPIAVRRGDERLISHGLDGRRCPGSFHKVDLYSSPTTAQGGDAP